MQAWCLKLDRSYSKVCFFTSDSTEFFGGLITTQSLSHPDSVPAVGFAPTGRFSGLWWQSISANMLGQQLVRKQSNKPPSGYHGFLKALKKKKKPIAEVLYLDYICAECKQDDSSLILALHSRHQAQDKATGILWVNETPLIFNIRLNLYLTIGLAHKKCVYNAPRSIINFFLLNSGKTAL